MTESRYRRTPRPSRRSGRSGRRAFTLVEVLVVVTIIALLAGMVGLRLLGVLGNTRGQIAASEAKSLANALETYILETGVQPEDGMDLGILLLPPDEGGGPGGPYLNKADAMLDPWGNAYYVRVPGEVNYDFDIVSFGADGQSGGTGEDADVTQ